MAQYDDEAPPPGYRYHYFGDPASGVSGRYPVPIETPVDGTAPNRDVLGTTAAPSLPTAAPESQPAPATGIAPHRPVAGEVPGGPTPEPTLDQMRYELARKNLTPADWLMGAGENAASILTSPLGMLGGYAGLAYHTLRGAPFKEANRRAADWAQASMYQPTTLAGQEIAEDYVHPVLTRLPPVISGIMPGLMRPPRGTVGALGQGIKRDISQFDNDVFNAQRGITPGYPTLGSEFSSAFVNPKPSVYEMLAGLEPSRIPSTASPAIKPVGKGAQAYDLGTPFPGHGNPSVMADDLHAMKYSTKPLFVFNEWDALNAKKLAPDVLDKFQREFFDYRFDNKPIDPATGQPHKGSTSVDEVIKLADAFTPIWNARNRATPENQIISPSQLLAINEAQNAWRAGPRRKYLENQAGTGAATDPLLAQIESTGFGLHPDVNPREATHLQGEADYARPQSARIHQTDPASYKGPIGVGAYKYPLVGTQTATTPVGKQFEDMMDRYLKVNRLQNYTLGNHLPADKTQYITPTTPVYDIDSSMANPLGPMEEKLREELLAGRIKPENIAQIDVKRLGLQMYKDEQARALKEAKANEGYKNFRTAMANDFDGEMLPNGNKLITFDRALTDKIGEHMMVRGLSIDTYDLDHCVAQCGVPPRNTTDPGYDTDPFKKRHFRPMVVPHTGVAPKEADYLGLYPPATGAPHGHTSYTRQISRGTTRILSLRDTTNGKALVTTQTNAPGPDGKFSVEQMMGYQDKGVATGAISPEAAQDMVTWLNQNAGNIETVGMTHGLAHVGVVDTNTRYANDSSTMGLAKANQDLDYDQIHKILDDYNINAATVGTPMTDRFIDYDTLKTIVRDSSISPYRSPDVTGTNHAANIQSLNGSINKYEGKRNEIIAGTDKINDLATVERHLNTLQTARAEQQAMLDQQQAARRMALASINTALDTKLTNFASTNNADPNFSFKLDDVHDDLKLLGHALMGDVYTPSVKLPDQLHKKIVNHIINSSDIDNANLKSYVENRNSSPAGLAKKGFSEVANLTEPQIRNLINIFRLTQDLRDHASDYAVRDYDPHFAHQNNIIYDDVKNTNEVLRQNAFDLEEAAQEFRNYPTDRNADQNLYAAKHNFRLAAEGSVTRYVADLMNSEADFNVDAYINDRVPPAIREDVKILSKLFTGTPQTSEARSFLRNYINDMADAMYSENKLKDVYDHIVGTARFPQPIIENGKRVLMEYAKLRSSPEQFNNLLAHMSQKDAEQLAIRAAFNIPADINTSAFMSQEVFTGDADLLRDKLSDLNDAANRLRNPTNEQFENFISSPSTARDLDFVGVQALDMLLDDRFNPITAQNYDRAKAQLISLVTDTFVSYGEINNFMNRIFVGGSRSHVADFKARAKLLTILDGVMRIRGVDIGKAVQSALERPEQHGYMPPGYGGVPQLPENMAKGGRVRRMDKGGKASKDDIMNLKPQSKAQDTSFASVRSLLADIGSNQEEYERIAQGGAFDRRKFTPENIYAMRLLQAANATPDPARYLESLNPYLDSQLQFKLNPFTNVLGYVDPAEPNKAVIQRLEQVENTIPHELTHTLQLGRGAAVEKGGIDKLIEMSRSENLARRKTALPEEMRKSVFPSANVNNAREIWANINARAHLINAAGGDFINSPEGRALFPTNTEQRDYYTNAMPSVNSITPDTGTFVPNRSNPNESYAAKIRRKLGMADGGAVFNPQGADYDYQTARAYGMGQEDGGHWGSVAPASEGERKLHGLPEDSYLMLKGAQHPTWGKAVEAETARGSKIVKHGDRYYSVPHKADGGAVTDTLDKMVKNPQASTLLNLDLPNLIAARQQTRAMKRGGKVEFSHNIDDMRYALTRRQG